MTCFFAAVAPAQTDNASAGSQLFNTARDFIKSGDYANAVLVLNQAIRADPDNLEYRQELAYADYLRQDNKQAYQIIHSLLQRNDANILTYQIAGDIYQAQDDFNGADKLYRKGIRVFPASGELYNDQGSLMYKEKKLQDALRSWVNGIRVDPSFAGNYFHAARMYYYSKDNVWSIIYGEIFVNLESFSTHTAEMRGILLESYKKLFDNPQVLSGNVPGPVEGHSDNRDKAHSTESLFRQAFLKTLVDQDAVISTGITTESLIMLRTRFLIEWENTYQAQYPFALFSYQLKLLRKGFFGAYNQWIFGPAANPALFHNWMNLHKEDYDNMISYIQDHPFAPVAGEFYNNGKIIFEESGKGNQDR
ncbi:MAG TPA: tetratricopeptide repeat protein [Chitinophagaceae bacterium]|nr:tetratricopeptide repeat protein [Chitinophagaceae bacterium]